MGVARHAFPARSRFGAGYQNIYKYLNIILQVKENIQTPRAEEEEDNWDGRRGGIWGDLELEFKYRERELQSKSQMFNKT